MCSGGKEPPELGLRSPASQALAGEAVLHLGGESSTVVDEEPNPTVAPVNMYECEAAEHSRANLLDQFDAEWVLVRRFHSSTVMNCRGGMMPGMKPPLLARARTRHRRFH